MQYKVTEASLVREGFLVSWWFSHQLVVFSRDRSLVNLLYTLASQLAHTLATQLALQTHYSADICSTPSPVNSLTLSLPKTKVASQVAHTLATHSVLQCVAVWWHSVLQCVAVCCSEERELTLSPLN